MTSREQRKRKVGQTSQQKHKRRRASVSVSEGQRKRDSDNLSSSQEGVIMPGGLEDEGPPLKEGENVRTNETKIYEDEEAADLAQKIREKKWKHQKRELGLEEDGNDNADSDFEFGDPEKPKDFSKLGEADPEELVNEKGDRIEPFNLTEELEEGKFEADGNFVWNPTGKRRQQERLTREREALKERQRRFAEEGQGTRQSLLRRGRFFRAQNADNNNDDDEEEDDRDNESESEEEAADRVWYEEVERRAHEDKDYYTRIKQHPAPLLREDDNSTDVDTVTLRRELIALLRPHENVLQAMRRLKPKNVTKGTKKGEKSATNNNNNNSQSSAENEAAFTALVEKADILLNNGFQNIYSETREQIEASLPKEEKTGEGPFFPSTTSSKANEFSSSTATTTTTTNTSTNTAMWEYKWSAEDTNVYGPFDTSTMLAWISQGAFGDGTQVRVRRVGTVEHSEFVPLSEIDWTR